MPKYMIHAAYTAEGLKGLQKDKASGRREVRQRRHQRARRQARRPLLRLRRHRRGVHGRYARQHGHGRARRGRLGLGAGAHPG